MAATCLVSTVTLFGARFPKECSPPCAEWLYSGNVMMGKRLLSSVVQRKIRELDLPQVRSGDGTRLGRSVRVERCRASAGSVGPSKPPASTPKAVATGTSAEAADNGGAVLTLSTESPIKEVAGEVNGWAKERSAIGAVNYGRTSATQAVHGGERTGKQPITDSLITPIVQTATYVFKDTAELVRFQEGTHKSWEYGRYGNPTTRTVEEKISYMECAEDTLLSASGMYAATTMLLALVPKGGHIVTTSDCYRRTRQFMEEFFPKLDVTTTVVDPADIASLEKVLIEKEVTLFFSESPTNPYLRCIDVERVSKLCHANGALVVIDSTFASPVNQRPLLMGADIVIHSATKYLSGHHDVLGGSLSGKRELVAAVRRLHHIMGGVMDAHAAYLLLRGLKTLDIRVCRQNETALRLAKLLEAHPRVLKVHYPGLPSHPEHEIAKKQMKGFGGVISFELDGDLESTGHFIDLLRIPYIAPSLGGCESLVEQPTIISYWDYSPADRARFGIKDNLVRFSCGIEAYEDIEADFVHALENF